MFKKYVLVNTLTGYPAADGKRFRTIRGAMRYRDRKLARGTFGVFAQFITVGKVL